MTTIKPFGKRVVVREDAIPDRVGLIYVPHVVKPETVWLPHICIVEAVGSKVESPEIKVGARVLINRLMPIAVLEALKLLVINEDDVMAVLED